MQEQLIIIYLQNLFKGAGCDEFGVPKKMFSSAWLSCNKQNLLWFFFFKKQQKNGAPLPWNALHQQQSDIWNLMDIDVSV